MGLQVFQPGDVATPGDTGYPQRKMRRAARALATALPVNDGRTMNAVDILRQRSVPLRVLIFGDSVASDSAEPAFTTLAAHVGEAGFSTFYRTRLGPFTSAGTPAYVTDAAAWFTPICRLSDAGDGYIIESSGVGTYVVGDRIQVIYRVRSGGGTFKIQTDPGTGTFADEASYTAVSTSGAEAVTSVTITKTLGKYRVKVLWVSGGDVDILSAGIYRASGPGVIAGEFARAGAAMSEWTALPAAVRQGWLTAQAADVIFLRWYEASIDDDLATLVADLTAIGRQTITDIVVLGVSPINPSSDDQIQQIYDRQQVCALYGAQLVELYDNFNTRFLEADGVHPNTNGYQWTGHELLRRLGWLDLLAVSRTAPQIAKRSAYTTLADSTTYSDDTTLRCYVGAGVYRVRIVLHFGTSSAGPGFKAQATFTGDNSTLWSGYKLNGASGAAPVRTMLLLTGGAAVPFPVELTSGNTAVTNGASEVEFMFQSYGPGLLQVQTAKEVTGGTMYIREGSYIEAQLVP